jgi:hypothetical protein
MINGRSMVLSLMAAAMLASLIARLISRPLYHTLSNLMINAVVKSAQPPERAEPEDAASHAGPAVTAAPMASETSGLAREDAGAPSATVDTAEATPQIGLFNAPEDDLGAANSPGDPSATPPSDAPGPKDP